ncbi:MAG: hypothetical protein ACTS4X_00480 [Candidatus Hodgkinia cicadicola]
MNFVPSVYWSCEVNNFNLLTSVRKFFGTAKAVNLFQLVKTIPLHWGINFRSFH